MPAQKMHVWQLVTWIRTVLGSRFAVREDCVPKQILKITVIYTARANLLIQQNNWVPTGFYSMPSVNANRRYGLDHRTCKECTNNMFLFEGSCVSKCPPGYNALGIGSQGRFCSSSWMPFAVTTDKKCAESLPYGFRSIKRSDEIIENGYLSFENSRVEHFYFLQRFFVDNQLLFESTWKFNTRKTLKERLIEASKNGEQVHWRVMTITECNTREVVLGTSRQQQK